MSTEPSIREERPVGMPVVEGVEHRFVELDDFRVHVAEAGEGDPVLLLHGWPQHWYMWRGVIERLASSFRLIAPDLRGFGWSDAPGQGYDPETFAADQIALLDALGLESVRVIGHDWGGFTSLLLGIRQPERIERVLACNTPHPWARVSPRLLLDLWRSWYAAGMALPLLGPRIAGSRVPRFVLTHGHSGRGISEPDLDVFLAQFREPARAGAASRLYRTYGRLFLEGIRGGRWRDQRLTVPTLLMFGENDLYVTPRLIDGHERHAPEMEVELVPDCGHFIVDEEPDLVARRALAFLS
jgi:pimeloyl-ACP methyl ester carboxylesterase